MTSDLLAIVNASQSEAKIEHSCEVICYLVVVVVVVSFISNRTQQ